MELLAQQTERYSGAEIENVVELAAEIAIRSILSSGNDRLITMQELLEAIEQTNPSTVEWLKTVKNYVKYSNQSGFIMMWTRTLQCTEKRWVSIPRLYPNA